MSLMLKDNFESAIMEGKPSITAKGMIYQVHPNYQVWGEFTVTDFTGRIVSLSSNIHSSMEVRFQVFASGALCLGDAVSYPTIVRVDNCHGELHEHNGNKTSRIEEKTIGEVISRLLKSRK